MAIYGYAVPHRAIWKTKNRESTHMVHVRWDGPLVWKASQYVVHTPEEIARNQAHQPEEPAKSHHLII